MMKFYVAYGSNMDVSQMKYRCPGARLLGQGVVKDYQLLFKGSKTGSYATIEPKPGATVPVLVWEVSDRDERSLDRYEGFPKFYYKKFVTVTDVMLGPDNKFRGMLDGMAYVLPESRPLGIPSKLYYEALQKAYARFGMDESILTTALSHSFEIPVDKSMESN